MKLLDLYCGAGGAGMGYHRAGFEVYGIDINPQPRYPFPFIQMDALLALRCLLDYRGLTFSNGEKLYLSDFDAFHASPPCQRYSTMTKRWGRSDNHPELIEPTRELLNKTGKSFVTENVPGAPLLNPVLLCGSMFGLKVRRHRLFELSFFTISPCCNHAAQSEVIGVYGHAGGSSKRDGLKFYNTEDWREAMGIDWMTGKELAESIPPAYTEWIGKQIMEMQS